MAGVLLSVGRHPHRRAGLGRLAPDRIDAGLGYVQL